MKMRWTRYAAHMIEMKIAQKCCLGKVKGRYNLKDFGIDGKIRYKMDHTGWEDVDCIRLAQDRIQ
jgi:hypothetical protein